MKKLFILFAFLFIPLVAILFIQCNDPVVEPTDMDTVVSIDKGETEPTAGNNLSFPAILADGYTLNDIGVAGFSTDDESFLTAYTGLNTGLSADELAIALGDTWYAQKVDGNVWQAGFINYSEVQGSEKVTFIDWGDNIESVNAKVDRPFRLEVTLYSNCMSDKLDQYTMALLANPSSKDEIQGTNGVSFRGKWATVASGKAKIVVQKYNLGSTLTWDPVAGNWDGAEDPDLSFGFAVELNVGGKLIYGASQGGWRPSVTGNYRITFYMPGSEVNFEGAAPGNYGQDAADYNPLNRPVVDSKNNITYVDMVVAEAGGSGGGGKKK